VSGVLPKLYGEPMLGNLTDAIDLESTLCGRNSTPCGCNSLRSFPERYRFILFHIVSYRFILFHIASHPQGVRASGVSRSYTASYCHILLPVQSTSEGVGSLVSRGIKINGFPSPGRTQSWSSPRRVCTAPSFSRCRSGGW
jgi:hypothetical protein